jgi:hypothetical protein
MNHETCRKDIPYPSVSNESVPSLINNLVSALYGTNVTKTVVNRQVVWNIPCDPNNTAQISDLPREAGEGLLCYMIRAFNNTQVAPVTLGGVQTLTNKTLISPIINSPSVSNLTATGSLTLPSGSVSPSYLSAGGPSWNSAGMLTTTGLTVTGSVALPANSVTAGNIADGSITNSDINASANIANSKLAGNPTSTNEINRIVLRDNNGNFSANTITSNLTGIATSATNIRGGTIGSIPYQTSANNTALIPSTTEGLVLICNGNAAPFWGTDQLGVTTNSDVSNGYKGEYRTQFRASGSAVDLATGTSKNVIALTLNAGDWDIGGNISFVLVGATSVFGASGYTGGASTTLNTLGAENTFAVQSLDLTTRTGTFGFVIPSQRILLSSSTPQVHLIARATFTAGTVSAYGRIFARRVR